MKTAALTKRWGGCRFEVGLYLPRAQRPLSDQRVTPSELQGLAEQVSATLAFTDQTASHGSASFETISRECGDCLRVSTQSRALPSTEVVNVSATRIENDIRGMRQEPMIMLREWLEPSRLRGC